MTGPQVTFKFKTPRELLEKAQREKARFIKTYRAWQANGSDEDTVADHFWNFVVTAYHVCDWAKHLGKDDVHQFVDSDEALAVCRVLANGSKHFEIDKNRYESAPAVETAPTISAGGVSSLMVPVTPKIKIQSERGTRTRFEAAELADRVVTAWEGYFTKHGL